MTKYIIAPKAYGDTSNRVTVEEKVHEGYFKVVADFQGPDAEKNARLFLAAESMLEMLKRVEWWLSTVDEGAAMQTEVRREIKKTEPPK